MLTAGVVELTPAVCLWVRGRVHSGLWPLGDSVGCFCFHACYSCFPITSSSVSYFPPDSDVHITVPYICLLYSMINTLTISVA